MRRSSLQQWAWLGGSPTVRTLAHGSQCWQRAGNHLCNFGRVERGRVYDEIGFSDHRLTLGAVLIDVVEPPLASFAGPLDSIAKRILIRVKHDVEDF
jgi:hypothetical protein